MGVTFQNARKIIDKFFGNVDAWRRVHGKAAQEREQEEPRSKRREEKERREGRKEKDSVSGWFAGGSLGGHHQYWMLFLLKALRMYCRSAENRRLFSYRYVVNEPCCRGNLVSSRCLWGEREIAMEGEPGTWVWRVKTHVKCVHLAYHLHPISSAIPSAWYILRISISSSHSGCN